MAIKVKEDKAKCLFFVAVISFLPILDTDPIYARARIGNDQHLMSS